MFYDELLDIRLYVDGVKTANNGEGEEESSWLDNALDWASGTVADARVGLSGGWKDTIQDKLQSAVSNQFSTDKQVKDFARATAKDLTTGGTTHTDAIAQMPSGGPMEQGMQETLKGNMSKAVMQSGQLHGVLGLGMNMFGQGGDTMGFLNNKFQSWMPGQTKQSFDEKGFGREIGNKFSPGSPAMRTFGDNMAGIVNETADNLVSTQGNNFGKMLYGLGTMNMDMLFGGVKDMFGMSDAPNEVPGVDTPDA